MARLISRLRWHRSPRARRARVLQTDRDPELEARRLLSVAIDVRYDYDNAHFFDDPGRRAVMQRAADTLGGMLDDSLTAVTPSGDDHWFATFRDPPTGQLTGIPDLKVPDKTLIVFVGGSNLGPGILGVSEPGGGQVWGSEDWFDRVRSRGQAGVLASPPTDYSTRGGTVAFNAAGVNWYFGTTTACIQTDQYDFYSTAIHELGHVLGYGYADSWQHCIDCRPDGTPDSFHGTNCVAANGGSPVPLADWGHWAMGTSSDGEAAAMAPAGQPCRREDFTRLDLAGLSDIGWSVTRDYVRFAAAMANVREDAGAATVEVHRLGDVSTTVSVHYATADVTAKAGTDYTPVSGTLTFGPGESSQSFVVPILKDTRHESTEGFNVVLSDPVGVPIYGGVGLAAIRILDDPPPAPSISISDATVYEGNRGGAVATFTVALSAPSDEPVSVIYGTSSSGLPGRQAMAGVDYVNVPATRLTFSPGELSRTVSVTIKRDRSIEPDETFAMNLWDASHVTIARGQGKGTILNDDTQVSINSVRVNEPSRGAATANFVVRLSARAAFPVTVVCSTADATASAGSDYVGLSPTIITFRPGETRRNVSIPILADQVREPNESFVVLLDHPTDAVLSTSRGTCTIIDARVRQRSAARPVMTSRLVAEVRRADDPVAQAIEALDRDALVGRPPRRRPSTRGLTGPG